MVLDGLDRQLAGHGMLVLVYSMATLYTASTELFQLPDTSLPYTRLWVPRFHGNQTPRKKNERRTPLQ